MASISAIAVTAPSMMKMLPAIAVSEVFIRPSARWRSGAIIAFTRASSSGETQG